MAKGYYTGAWYNLPESTPMMYGVKVREKLGVPASEDLYCLYVDVPDNVLIEPDVRYSFSGNVHFYSAPRKINGG